MLQGVLLSIQVYELSETKWRANVFRPHSLKLNPKPFKLNLTKPGKIEAQAPPGQRSRSTSDEMPASRWCR